MFHSSCFTWQVPHFFAWRRKMSLHIQPLVRTWTCTRSLENKFFTSFQTKKVFCNESVINKLYSIQKQLEAYCGRINASSWKPVKLFHPGRKCAKAPQLYMPKVQATVEKLVWPEQICVDGNSPPKVGFTAENEATLAENTLTHGSLAKLTEKNSAQQATGRRWELSAFHDVVQQFQFVVEPRHTLRNWRRS